MEVSIAEARYMLADLIERVLQGEEVILLRDGQPVAKMIPFVEETGLRPMGLDRQVIDEAAFEESMRPLNDEELKDWY